MCVHRNNSTNSVYIVYSKYNRTNLLLYIINKITHFKVLIIVHILLKCSKVVHILSSLHLNSLY